MSEDNDDTTARQRRNFMALSLFLLVAQVPTKLKTEMMTLQPYSPFTIGMILWVVWIYWAWRYYTYARREMTSSFKGEYRPELMHLVTKAAIRAVGRSREQTKVLNDHMADGQRWEVLREGAFVNPLRAASKHGRRVELSVHVFHPDNTVTDLGWRPEVEVTGVRYYVLVVRASLHVLFRTPLFVDRVLPWLLAAVTAAFGIYRLLGR